jgi:hypothetical protein
MAIYMWPNPASPYGKSILIRTINGVTGIAISEACCCVEDECEGCECLPDELELQFDFCGRTWIETLTFRGENLGRKVWQTECDIGFYTDCPQAHGGGLINTTHCLVFICEPEGGYYIRYGSSCPGANGDCNDTASADHEHDSVTTNPFEVVFHDHLLNAGNICDDSPPCGDTVPTITVRIPLPPPMESVCRNWI